MSLEEEVKSSMPKNHNSARLPPYSIVLKQQPREKSGSHNTNCNTNDQSRMIPSIKQQIRQQHSPKYPLSYK